MTHDASHEFDPITQEDVAEFRAGLDRDNLTGQLAIEDFQRAIADVGFHNSFLAGEANPEHVEMLGKLLDDREKHPTDPDHTDNH
jgi:hypothetical protein